MKDKSKEIWANTATITALSACIMLGAVGAYRLTAGELAHASEKKEGEGSAVTETDGSEDAPSA